MVNTKLKFIMLIGIPGAGKSTYIKQLGLDNLTIVSTDDILEAKVIETGKTYSEMFRTFYDKAQKIAFNNFKKGVESGNNIVWDQTNLTVVKRKSILRKVPDKYYKKLYYLLLIWM